VPTLTVDGAHERREFVKRRGRMASARSEVVAGIDDLENKPCIWLCRWDALHLLNLLPTLIWRRAKEVLNPRDRDRV
jgi:hypothetical protein